MALTINNPTSLGNNTADASAQANISRLYTGSASVGDLVLASVGYGLGSTPTSMTVSDDAGNTFTLAEQADRLTGNTPHAWLYYCVLTHAVTSANRLTITPSTSFNFPVMDIGKATVTGGTWNASPVDKIAANSGSSTAPSSGATTTTAQANELVFGAICTGSPQTVTWNNSNTGLDHGSTTNKALDTGYQVLTGTGTPQASGTITSADWAAAVATFKASATSPPTNTVAPAVTGTATVGSVLTTTNGTWTDAGSPTFTYQWQRDVAGNGVYSNIVAATSSTYTLVSADDTCHVRCVVTDTDANGATAANSNAAGVVTFPVPVNSVAPAVTGTVHVGSVLTTDNGTWSNTPTSYTYQWQDSANGSTGWANIAASTASTYTIGSGEDTKFIRCNVAAVNDGGTATAVSSNVVGAVVFGVPVNSVAPVVSGSTPVGSVLTTTNGTWSNTPTSFTYQWTRDGSNIAAATSSTYTTVNADATHLVRCKVVAVNDGGSSSAATSNAITVDAVSLSTVVGKTGTTGTAVMQKTGSGYTYVTGKTGTSGTAVDQKGAGSFTKVTGH